MDSCRSYIRWSKNAWESVMYAFADSAKETDKEKNKKEGIGTFYNLPHYMKIYEVLRGAYSNYRVRVFNSNNGLTF